MTGHRSNRHLEFKDAASDCRGPTSKDEEGEWKRYVCHVGWNGGPKAQTPHIDEDPRWKTDCFGVWGFKLADHCKSATEAQMAR